VARATGAAWLAPYASDSQSSQRGNYQFPGSAIAETTWIDRLDRSEFRRPAPYQMAVRDEARCNAPHPLGY
jgi:hypothetical protein